MPRSTRRSPGTNKTLSHGDYISLVVGNDSPLAEPVFESWRRCLTTHHLDPDHRGTPHVVTDNELRYSREPLGNLIALAQEEIDRLYAIVRAEEYVVLLCDSEGVAVHHRGNQSKAEDFKYWGIWLGGVWSEDVEGTNGIGTCVAEQRPTFVHGRQHFRTRHTGLSCAGAPIFDPAGKLAAVLDTSTINPETSEQSLSLAMSATRMSARGIEERMFRAHFRRAWNVAAAPDGDIDRAILLAVDNDQQVAGADHPARRMFGLTDKSLDRGISPSYISCP